MQMLLGFLEVDDFFEDPSISDIFKVQYFRVWKLVNCIWTEYYLYAMSHQIVYWLIDMVNIVLNICVFLYNNAGFCYNCTNVVVLTILSLAYASQGTVHCV